MEIAKMLTQAQKDRWVQTMRSGEVKKTEGCLRRTEKDGSYCYCALGVLALQEGMEFSVQGETIKGDVDDYRSFFPLLGKEATNTTFRMSDGYYTWDKVADWVEANIECLS